MKTHLLMVNGPEQRDFIIEQTIDRCTPYFDCIKIVQNGLSNIEPSDKIKSYIISSSKTFKPFYHACQTLLDSVCIGDWFLYIDSDECPNLELLIHIHNKQFADCNTYQVPFYHHCISNGEVTSVIDGSYFTPARFFKKEKSTVPSVYMDLHFGFISDNMNVFKNDSYRINHYKDYLATGLSTVSHYLSFPESIGVQKDIDEVKKIVSRFDSYNMTTIYETFEDKKLWGSILDAAEHLRNEPDLSFLKNLHTYLTLIASSDKKLAEIYRYNKCIQPCCDYV